VRRAGLPGPGRKGCARPDSGRAKLSRVNPRLSFAFILLVAAVTVAAVFVTSAPPEPSRSPTGFSSTRAMTTLRTMIGNGAPHPQGSPENRRVRDTILGELAALGIEARVERGFACGSSTCGDVENIVATLGPREGRRVLLTSHYDSVAAGPGAADAGYGCVTLLEIARILRSETLRHPLTLLFTDGEESDLLGARAFAASPAMKEIGAIINIEARGTRGASLMFETGPGDLDEMRLFRRAVEHPVTGSLFVTIYKLLPNDTDFSVYKPAGVPGYNFANLDRVTRYHTRHDSLAFAEADTIQHHGDNALALVRALQTVPLERLRGGDDAVFTHLFGSTTLVWSERTNLIVALLVAFVTLALLIASVRRRRAAALRTMAAFLFPLLNMALAAGLAWGAMFILGRSGMTPTEFVAEPRPLTAIAWLVAALSTLVVGRLAGSHDVREVVLGQLVLWSTLSLAAALTLPGITYPFLIPALCLLLSAVVALIARDSIALAITVAVTTVCTLAVIVFTATVLYPALGTPLIPAVAALLALGFSVMIPLVRRTEARLAQGVLLGLGAMLVLAMAIGLSRAPYDEANPPRLDLTVVSGEGLGGRLVATAADETLPEALQIAGTFRRTAEALPWSEAVRFVSPWKVPLAAPPEYTLLSDRRSGERRTVSIHVRSKRGAPIARVYVRGAKSVAARIRGTKVAPSRRRGGSRTFQDLTMPAEGSGFELDITGREAELWVADVTRGLPPEASRIVRVRDASGSAYGAGDETIAAVKVE
jgi:hypothetical protein